MKRKKDVAGTVIIIVSLVVGLVASVYGVKYYKEQQSWNKAVLTYVSGNLYGGVVDGKYAELPAKAVYDSGDKRTFYIDSTTGKYSDAIYLFGVSAFPVIISTLPIAAVMISRMEEKEKCYEELP